jgi:hypothetical protein
MTRPNFDIEGATRARYCGKCADRTNMINVKDPKCIKCKVKVPTFDIEGATTARYCGKCADRTTMVNIRTPKCINCKVKQPNFDIEGATRARYCKDCADPNMINVKDLKCIKCKVKVPNFDIEGATRARYCGTCADRTTMVDIKHPKCIKCKMTRPNFDIEGATRARYCGKCADRTTMVDIKHPKCTDDHCNTRASYGIPGLAPSKCAKHKLEHMISKPRSICKKANCKNIAIYGVKSPIHCELHKDENDINLTETHCEKCGLLDVCIDGLCINVCSNSEKITYEMKRRQKVKELRVFNILTCEYCKPHEYNVRVSSSCGGKHSEEKEFGYDFGTHKLYIEVDENQHKSYCELGEINRMKNIYMDDGGIPILFLRYNPDNYQTNGKKQNTSQKKREIELIKWIKYYENFENLKGYNLSVQYLFYTDGDNTKLHNIEPYES